MKPTSDRILAVIQRDIDWAQAHLDLNLKVLDDIASEDYRQIQPDGTSSGKAELLESYGSGKRKWTIAESYDHHVQFADSLAIVLGRWRGKGVNDGEKFDYHARFISIYRLENGQWRMILDRSIEI